MPINCIFAVRCKFGDNRMNSEQTIQIKNLLKSAKKIVVVGHKNPDGDAVGSCLGLANYLRQKGHSVQVVMPNDFPRLLAFNKLPFCQASISHNLRVILGLAGMPRIGKSFSI